MINFKEVYVIMIDSL